MPRLYLSVVDFQGHPAALAFPTQIAQLQAVSGGLDRLLARASRRVDGFARKRIQAPPTTTVGTGGIAQGGTSLPLTSTLGYDNGQEEAVVIGTGGTSEIIAVAPGGVAVSSWSGVYAGTITLASPTAYAHSAGETVQGCYQEVSTVGSSGSSDIYSESLLEMSQDAQIAAAHAPRMIAGNLTRVLFLKCYPITQLLMLEHMLSFTTVYGPLNINSVGIAVNAGYLRLPIGALVVPEGLLRATYTAGFINVPEEAAEAAAWYAADDLQTIISQGSHDSLQGKRRNRWQEAGESKSLYVQRAEQIILDSGLKRMT